ncbi:MAG: hypothetical protein L0216_09850 [Planctomycetales bacterium]|nr:hypothetical protein [Planctomycetales bacterium]
MATPAPRAPGLIGLLSGAVASAFLLAPPGSRLGGLLPAGELAETLAGLAAAAGLAAGVVGTPGGSLLLPVLIVGAVLPAAAAAAVLAPDPARAGAALLAASVAGVLAGAAAGRLRVRGGPEVGRAFLLAAAALLLAPPLLDLVWRTCGETAGPLPGWLSPIGPGPVRAEASLPLGLLGLAGLAAARTLPHAALAVALLAAAGAARPEAPPPDADVALRIPWGDLYRPGRLLPVEVTVRTRSAVAAELRIEVRGGTPVVLRADIPAGSSRRYVVPVVGHGDSSEVRARWGGAPESAAPGAEAALSRGPREALRVLAVGPPAESARVAAALGPAPSRVAAVAEEDLPSFAPLLGAADLVVIGLGAPSREAAWPSGAAEALGGWVRAGGRLVLADPDLLRRLPALDGALFETRVPSEDSGPGVFGLRPAFSARLRERGLGPGDVLEASGGVPLAVQFSSGAGRGALLFRDPEPPAPGEEAPPDPRPALLGRAWEAIAPGTAVAGEGDTPPTLRRELLQLFPGPALGPRTAAALAGLLLAHGAALLALRRRPRTGLAASLPAAAGAALLAGAAAGAVVEAAPILPGDPRAGDAAEVLLHAAAGRTTRPSVGIPRDGVPRRLIARLSEADAPAGETGLWRSAEPATLEFPPVAPGGRALASLLVPAPLLPGPGGTRGPRAGIRAILAGDSLVLANATGLDLPEVLLARPGGLDPLGPLAAGEVKRVALAPRPRGPLAVLGEVEGRLGPEPARALRIAHERTSGPDPSLLALAPGAPLPSLAAREGALRLLPPVLVARVEGR